MGTIDLHTHSILSDGTDSIYELVNKAKAQGISYLSVTDHNTLSSGEEIAFYSTPTLELLQGAEFTARCKNGKLHLTSYCFDSTNLALQNMVDKIRRLRLRRMYDYLNILEMKFQVTLPPDVIYKAIGTNTDIGKPYFAAILKKHHYVRTEEEAFQKYLRPISEELDTDRFKLSPNQVIDTVHEAGGVVCLAHFHTLRKEANDLYQYVGYLKRIGLDGIEVCHSSFGPERQKTAKCLAHQHNLLESVGTDYHGRRKPEIVLGRGKGDNCFTTQCSLIDHLIKTEKVKKMEKRI